ncbi:MAG: ATP-binding protein, partial [Gammaproteobacteria bacterium]
MSKRTPFIGRQYELKRLVDTTKKQTASFIVIKGRRRIGKSRLVEEFSKQFDYYYKFEGLAPEKNVTADHQVDEFCRQMARQFQIPKAKYDDWSDALWAVGERVSSGKVLLFFDELSWMGSKDPAFLGKIKLLWDNQLSKNPQLVFIICSSASAWIEKNLLSSTGFVGRISLTLKLEELSLAECNHFWPKNISAYEKLKVLAVIGGIPKYLEEINPKECAEENIKRLCFTDGGFLVKEFNSIFSDLFLRESIFYKKIVNALKEGARDQSEIQAETCNDDDYKHTGRIPEYLWELEESGFIKRDYTWNIKTGKDSKLSKYRLQDNYLRFYLKYIEKNLNKIERGTFNFKSLTSLSEWNTIMGFQFENLILNNRK